MLQKLCYARLTTHQNCRFHHNRFEWFMRNHSTALLPMFTYTESMRSQRESMNCQLSFGERGSTRALCWVKKAMASVIGLPVRWSRLKIVNLRPFSRTFSSNRQVYRKINSGHKYWWYLLGGSACAAAYFKWQNSSAVGAFNPKKMKVSVSVVYFYIYSGTLISEYHGLVNYISFNWLFKLEITMQNLHSVESLNIFILRRKICSIHSCLCVWRWRWHTQTLSENCHRGVAWHSALTLNIGFKIETYDCALHAFGQLRRECFSLQLRESQRLKSTHSISFCLTWNISYR